jgi:UDP-N-acetylglucosamine 2-epimerase (non-hydrolysing)
VTLSERSQPDKPSAMKKVAIVFGTRPEAIKMAPLIKSLRCQPSISTSVIATGQHRELLSQALSLFEIKTDLDLQVMLPDQGLAELFSRVLLGVTGALQDCGPDLVVVHGDTSTTLAASLAAFYLSIPVAHVEAGLRSGNMRAPWPEEANRRLTAPLSSLHFAPTERARAKLLAEGISPQTIFVTGNTVIDALLDAVAILERSESRRSELDRLLPSLRTDKRILLVTGHRRENFGPGIESICGALRDICSVRDVQVVYPVHPNPSIRSSVQRMLSGIDDIHLVEPLDYLPFVRLMSRADLILTDSGGVQEEAPSLGKPVLVTRDTTERPEAVDAGGVRVVGTDRLTIVTEVLRLLDDPAAYDRMARAPNPFGDGRAGSRIAAIINDYLSAEVSPRS